MSIKKTDVVIDLLESTKNFFVDLLRPNMTIEKISEVVSPRLDDTIDKYEERGFKYSAGKFTIKYVDEKHFRLEVEMYFQDIENKWHKFANESENRDAALLEDGAWKTIKALKVITFPIEKSTDNAESKENVSPVPQKKAPVKSSATSFDELSAYLSGATNWQDFHTRFKEFASKVPSALKNEGIEDYASKIYSCVEGDNLFIAYTFYYKQYDKWVERNVSCELSEATAPTWATTALSAEKSDVTERYEKNFQIKVNVCPTFKELNSCLHAAKTWTEFETRLKEYATKLPLMLKSNGISDYALKLFSCIVEDDENIFAFMRSATPKLCVSCKCYYKEDDSWFVTTLVCKLDALEAPTWATKGLSDKEFNVTERYKKNLGLII